jgi:hypothetical protein
MNYSTIRHIVILHFLLVFTLALSSYSHAFETVNQVNLANVETTQLDVRNGYITGVIKNKSLKHVLESLSEKLGFTLKYRDDLTGYYVSLDYDQKDTLAVLKEMLGEFNYVIITNSNLSIEKVFVLGLKQSQSAETKNIVSVVAEIETPEQTIIPSDFYEDFEPPMIPVSTEFPLFDKERFFKQLEQDMPQLDV